MDLGLNNKRVLVSGSTRGIGKAIATGFGEEGARVVFCSRHPADLDALQHEHASRGEAQKHLYLACDFTDGQQVAAIADQINEAWGGLDIAVANVGSGRGGSETIPSEDFFREQMAVNLDSAVHLARAFLKLLRQSRGNMVFIGSIAGLEAYGAPIAYATAKTALASFAGNLARTLAPEGIRVNCVAPGNVFFEDGTWGEKQCRDPEAVSRMLQANVPLARFGQGHEIADAVLFLASRRADFITGTTLRVDGGQTAGLF